MIGLTLPGLKHHCPSLSATCNMTPKQTAGLDRSDPTLFPVCPHHADGCPGRIAVYRCRGTKRPENKGKYYEAVSHLPVET
jgi:hypothetical protein